MATLEARVREARDGLEAFVRVMVDDDGALRIKEANGRGLSKYAAALIAAAEALGAAKERQAIREAVEKVKGLTATVSAYSQWSEAEERPRTVDAELEGVYFIRQSDALTAIDALPTA
jgi:hypothetical protein